MASSVYSTEKHAVGDVKARTFIGNIGFDRVMSILSVWFISGLFVDGWAHSHGKVDNTFFTPWHAVLYSGYFAMAIALIIVTVLNHARGYQWLRSIPRGYELSLFGVPLFTIGGVGDLIWHTLFGFEVGVEPLLSPTHLLLAFSASLMMSGPLRAIWRRRNTNGLQGWSLLFPALLSLTTVLALFTFFTSFAHPVVDWYLVTNGVADSAKSRGASAILLQTLILMGTLLLTMRRWQLPLGSMTMLLTINTALMTVFSDSYMLIPMGFVAGLLADVLLWRLQPSIERVGELRIFAFAVPTLFYLLYFATLGLTYGITWSIHLWLGSSIMAGVVGVLLSYLLVAPRGPVEVEQ